MTTNAIRAHTATRAKVLRTIIRPPIAKPWELETTKGNTPSVNPSLGRISVALIAKIHFPHRAITVPFDGFAEISEGNESVPGKRNYAAYVGGSPSIGWLITQNPLGINDFAMQPVE
jgi:hypothetical protein